MIGVDVKVEIKKKSWLSDPRKLWNAGLKHAAQAWETEARKYPPAPPNVGLQGTGTRTGNLGKKASYRIVREGVEMHLLGPTYYRYLLFGTGIYGPRGAPIMGNPFLVWRVTDMTHPLAGKVVRVRAVRGTIWPGKREEVIRALREGFLEGVRKGKAETE